jgi:hypothetical protein
MEVCLSLSCSWQADKYVYQVAIAFLFPWEVEEPLKAAESCSLPFCSTVENPLLTVINEGFEQREPQLIDEGLGGAYILFDKHGQPAAVWKPANEELSADQNPKHRQPDRNGFSSGYGYVREAAAYLLDSTASVPRTLIANHNGQLGSIQEFMKNDGSAEDYGPGKYQVDQVHKLGLLDLRLLNTDRHGGNILVKHDDSEHSSLIPIDHGFCLGNAESLQEILDFEWLHWPQAKEPFNTEVKQQILSIDIEHEVQTLRRLGIGEDAILLHRAADHFCRWAIKKGWNLQQMGVFVTRPDPDVCSQFETLFLSACGASDWLSAFDQELASVN